MSNYILASSLFLVAFLHVAHVALQETQAWHMLFLFRPATLPASPSSSLSFTASLGTCRTSAPRLARAWSTSLRCAWPAPGRRARTAAGHCPAGVAAQPCCGGAREGEAGAEGAFFFKKAERRSLRTPTRLDVPNGRSKRTVPNLRLSLRLVRTLEVWASLGHG